MALSGWTPAEAAPAKINLFLHVGEKRADGFHALQSLAVFTDFGDRLNAKAAETLTLSLAGPFAGALSSSDNLVLKAAQSLAARAKLAPDVNLTLEKNLPVASGIGGGSTDAAATLRLLTALWGLDASLADAIAAELGSDVPVCLAAGPSFMEGRGEILTGLASLPRLSLLLVNPGVPVATRDIFALLSARRGVGMALPEGRFHDLGDLLRFLENTGNDLEAPALALQPAIGAVLAALRNLPGALFTRMSGSGATCFAIFPDDESAARAGTLLKQKQPDWWVQPSFVPELNIEHEDRGRDIGPSPDGL